jgi:hypothetical protein
LFLSQRSSSSLSPCSAQPNFSVSCSLPELLPPRALLPPCALPLLLVLQAVAAAELPWRARPPASSLSRLCSSWRPRVELLLPCSSACSVPSCPPCFSLPRGFHPLLAIASRAPSPWDFPLPGRARPGPFLLQLTTPSSSARLELKLPRAGALRIPRHVHGRTQLVSLELAPARASSCVVPTSRAIFSVRASRHVSLVFPPCAREISLLAGAWSVLHCAMLFLCAR